MPLTNTNKHFLSNERKCLRFSNFNIQFSCCRSQKTRIALKNSRIMSSHFQFYNTVKLVWFSTWLMRRKKRISMQISKSTQLVTLHWHRPQKGLSRKVHQLGLLRIFPPGQYAKKRRHSVLDVQSSQFLGTYHVYFNFVCEKRKHSSEGIKSRSLFRICLSRGALMGRSTNLKISYLATSMTYHSDNSCQ